MSRKRKFIIAGAAAAALAASSIGIASAVNGGEDEQQATGPGADKARAAALAITGGKANAVERDSENGGTWEVEVTRPDGKTVDVRLDEKYDLVGVEGDSEASDANESDGNEAE